MVQHFDMADRVWREETTYNGVSHRTDTEYGGLGHKVLESIYENDALLTKTMYVYNAMGQLAETNFPSEQFNEGRKVVQVTPRTKYTYDATGNISSQQRLMADGTWNIGTFEYDSLVYV